MDKGEHYWDMRVTALEKRTNETEKTDKEMHKCVDKLREQVAVMASQQKDTKESIDGLSEKLDQFLNDYVKTRSKVESHDKTFTNMWALLLVVIGAVITGAAAIISGVI